MEKISQIEIRVTGKKGNQELGRENYDIREIMTVLEQVEGLLYPNDKNNRPLISYSIEEGSVKHLLKTSTQAIIGFNALLGQIVSNQNIDFLDLPTAQAIEMFQNMAVKKDYSFKVRTSLTNSYELQIDKATYFYRNSAFWADAEFYFYGKVTNAGGKDKANIQENNILYKTFGIRAKGKQHSETGEIDKASLSFIEIVDYISNYDEVYLKKLKEKASWLKKVDPDEWLKEIRGYDA